MTDLFRKHMAVTQDLYSDDLSCDIGKHISSFGVILERGNVTKTQLYLILFGV